MEVVLASASPRRSELLRSIGLEFRVIASDVAEEKYHQGSPAAYARALAQAKALAVAKEVPHAIVIGADTIVVCGDEVLGKPKDSADASRMLHFLSGRRHEVITGVAVVAGSGPCSGQLLITHEQTGVEFRPLLDHEIEAYVHTGEPLDKAGSYGIQGLASLFVQRIDGCYFNVVGLPLNRLSKLLMQCGVPIFG